MVRYGSTTATRDITLLSRNYVNSDTIHSDGDECRRIERKLLDEQTDQSSSISYIKNELASSKRTTKKVENYLISGN
ncbi:hypothetical protein T07_4454 [Trichinella nelsoni]|uniref:Uncharacterized protein n=1 Tax=Trichinella nelsoni TaxID=6336 RepID=A0A0V0S0B2_9BILA|nr:hypothetical protein T07_4454 [Trichinella nelsoni]